MMFRVFTDVGVRRGRAYKTKEKAIAYLRRMDSPGYVEKLYHGVVAAKNQTRGCVLTLDNDGMPRHVGDVTTSLGNPNPNPFK